MKNFFPTMLEPLVEFLFPKAKEIKDIERLNPYEFSLRVEKSTHPHTLLTYHDPLVEKALWELKYHANRKVAALFAPLLYEHLIDMIAEQSYFGSLDKPLVTTIPPSRTRLRTKHFDQGILLLGALDKEDVSQQFEFEADILTRTKDTVAQHLTKNKKERLTNMHEAFRVIDSQKTQHKIVIVIDDILTTGATLNDAKRALLAGGAREVHVLAIAH